MNFDTCFLFLYQLLLLNLSITIRWWFPFQFVSWMFMVLISLMKSFQHLQDMTKTIVLMMCNPRMSQAQKQPNIQDFPNQIENKDKLNTKSKLWNKKTKTKTWQVQNKNSTRFYCKNEIRIEQSCDKKIYPRLMLNILKVIRNSTFIYTFWAPSSNKFFKKTSNLHVINVRPCAFICELWMN